MAIGAAKASMARLRGRRATPEVAVGFLALACLPVRITCAQALSRWGRRSSGWLTRSFFATTSTRRQRPSGQRARRRRTVPRPSEDMAVRWTGGGRGAKASGHAGSAAICNDCKSHARRAALRIYGASRSRRVPHDSEHCVSYVSTALSASSSCMHAHRPHARS